MKRVCVIVITFNGLHHLQKLLPTLCGIPGTSDHVILVDNASGDGSSEYTKANFSWVEVMKNSTNLGFAQGNNEAMKVAVERGFQFVLLLNDDTVILDENWIDDAVQVFEVDSSVGFVGFEAAPSPEPQVRTKLSWSETNRVDGWGMLISSDLLSRIGYFDETYFAYSEESDLQARAQLAGYSLAKVNTPVYHAGGGSFGKQPVNRVYLRTRNWIRYAIKTESAIGATKRFGQIVVLALAPSRVGPPAFRAATAMFDTGSVFSRLFVVGKAIGWNCVHLPGTLAARRHDLGRARQAKRDRIENAQV